MKMKRFEKLLRENLKQVTPDILDKLTDENSYKLNASLQPMPRAKRFITVSAGVCCIAICIVVTFYAMRNFNLFGSYVDNSSSNPGSSTASSSAEGGSTGEQYPIGTIKIGCPVPANYNLYKLIGNNAIGNFTEILSALFGFKVTGSDAHQVNFTADNSNIILFGDLETGLFSYQNNRRLGAALGSYANDPTIKDKTYRSAIEIVNTLKPIIGEVTLKDSRIERINTAEVEGQPAYTSVSYYYIFEPETVRKIEGYADGSELRISFDADGFVFSIYNQITNAKTNMDAQFAVDVNEFFKTNITYNMKDAEVVLTKWDVYYVANPEFDGTSEMEPCVNYEYTVNGKNMTGGVALTALIK